MLHLRNPPCLALGALLAATLGACRSEPATSKGTVHYAWEVDPEALPIPYGFWGLNGYQSPQGLQEVQDRFGISLFHTSTRHPDYGTNELLPMVRDAGMQVNLRLAGGHELYTTEEGDFDLDGWKGMIDNWRGSGIQAFIDDGTLAFHMLLDDISTFEGRSPSGNDLDEMARYSKEVLPGLPVLIREEATRMPVPERGYYLHLDASVNQYRTQDGDVEDFAVATAEAANKLGIGLVNGLNIANGGDGSSGQPGWEDGRYAMSAEEIVDYGYVLTAVPGCIMFLAWEYDGEEEWADGSVGSDYFDSPDLEEALSWVGRRLSGAEPLY